MTEVNLKIPISLKLGNVDSDLKPGRHKFTEEQMSLWFIKGLIDSGKIEVINKKELTKKINTLDYSKYKITLGEGGRPVQMTKTEPIPEVIPEKGKWEKIIGEEEDLNMESDSLDSSEPEPKLEPEKKESTKIKVIRTKKVIK